MFDVVLYQPEIPPNTGNVMRLCANTGASLHLIEPLGFRLEDRLLRRAGLDYREWAAVRTHASLRGYIAAAAPSRLFACSTRGTRCYAEARFAPGDALLFGPETRGLPVGLLEDTPPQRRLYIPMQPRNRSLNLSNAVAVVLFEAWRQMGFRGAARAGRRPAPAAPNPDVAEPEPGL
jgi:tRNA (cytidine/uridine-2'-O-)-methyltransferase